MSDSFPTEPQGQETPPTEEEIRAAIDEEMSRIHVADVILQSVVTLVQLAGRRLGTTPGTEPERDLEQARIAIDSVAALLPSVELIAPTQAPSVANALSQLRLAFVRAGGAPPAPAAAESSDPTDPSQGQANPGAGEPSAGSRIWVPPGIRGS